MLGHLLDNTGKAFARLGLASMRNQHIPETRNQSVAIFQIFATVSYTVFKASSAAEGHLDHRAGRIEATYLKHLKQSKFPLLMDKKNSFPSKKIKKKSY